MTQVFSIKMVNRWALPSERLAELDTVRAVKYNRSGVVRGCTNWFTLGDVPGIILPQGEQETDLRMFLHSKLTREKNRTCLLAIPIGMLILFIRKSHNLGMLVIIFGMMKEWLQATSGEEIANAVIGCSVFLCFISPRATDSINCRNEINLALNEKKPFLAIHLEETELPPGLRLRMGDLQAVIKEKIPVERYFSKVTNTLDQLLGRKTKVNLGAAEKASMLYISRDGQTFGPYNHDQATQFLQAGQLLSSDYAMLEGQTEWKFLPEVLNSLKEAATRHAMAASADLPQAKLVASEKRSPKKKVGKKSVKIGGMNAKQTRIKVKEKSLVSKIIATFAVFFGTALIVAGSTLGAYLIAPEQVGPVVRKFGIPIELWFPGREADSVEIVQAPPGTMADVKLAPEQWHHLRSSGITLMPIEGKDGLQVISPVDPKLAMNDDDLKILQYIAST